MAHRFSFKGEILLLKAHFCPVIPARLDQAAAVHFLLVIHMLKLEEAVAMALLSMRSMHEKVCTS
ncbi:hypothetical protein P4910_13655 [Pantoea stewartii]|uniref:hypothetical protein n=1 Tax=Pantoea stewartii TaxID=66269 RepID=UPI0023F9A469|nr:hypothetical protein [Pantoea stewartii]MDF7786529.1 hypothetical protein [Pantoea stewartii]MEB6536143.1 hypothetical protein [Pantoea stewartii]